MRRNPTAVAVKVALARADMRQGDLAGVLGVSQAAVSRRMAGAVSFTADELHTLARHLDVPASDLIGTVEPEAVSS